MNTEIKEKIEMINRGQVPKGYKKTKVGIIPEEWEVKKIQDIIESLEAGVSVNSEDKRAGKNELGILKTSSVSGGYFFHTENKRILEEEINRVKLNPQKGSVIISRMNTPELVGEVGYVDKNYDNLFLPDRLWQTVFKKDTYVNGKWLANLLTTEKIRFKIKDIATGTSNSMKNISQSNFLLISVAYPNKKEQQEIAQILSAWDKAIELKEKLIEEKKEQKKGLMQKLLTGEVRLPGLDGEWEEVRLGEVIELQGGYAFESSSYKEDGVPIVRISNIEKIVNLNKDVVYYDPIKIDDKFLVKKGDLLIAMSGATTGKTGVYRNYNIAYLNQRVGKFIAIREELYYQYLYHIVENKEFQNQLNKRLVAGAQPNISSADVESLIFKMPSLKEQKAIAQILSTADKEIDLLTQQLDLLKLQKKGLMQLLLTGIVRVKC